MSDEKVRQNESIFVWGKQVWNGMWCAVVAIFSKKKKKLPEIPALNGKYVVWGWCVVNIQTLYFYIFFFSINQ